MRVKNMQKWEFERQCNKIYVTFLDSSHDASLSMLLKSLFVANQWSKFQRNRLVVNPVWFWAALHSWRNNGFRAPYKAKLALAHSTLSRNLGNFFQQRNNHDNGRLKIPWNTTGLLEKSLIFLGYSLIEAILLPRLTSFSIPSLAIKFSHHWSFFLSYLIIRP